MSHPVVIKPKEVHTATLFFLHGLGDNGHGWASTFGEIVPSYVKVVCPTAPQQPVTLNGGFTMPSWFDILSLAPDGKEDEAGIRAAGESIKQMLADEERRSGISSKRIVLGGFSQGGGLALHTGFRYSKPLAGLLAFSCWLPLHKEYPAAASEVNKNVPILQCHGDSDVIVPYVWGNRSATLMKSFNSKHEFKTYPSMGHSSSNEELRDAKDFIKRILPAV